MSKVLIVEDEKSLRDALVTKFEAEGFDVVSAENGEVGLNLALNESPDIVLLDIIMPVMDGVTMLGKLRDDDRGKNIKVIILTNLSDGDKMATSIDEGSREYLIKSDWTLTDLVEKVRSILAE